MTRLTVVTERPELVSAMCAEFEVVRAAGEPHHRLTEDGAPDAYLIDAAGFEQEALVEYLSRASDRPIIVLAQGGPSELVAAYLEAGADAVVRSANALEECTARVKALTRRSDTTAGEPRYRFGDVILYPERRSVMARGESVHFTRTEFSLLLALAQRLDEVTTHRQLMAEVWGQEYLSARHYLRVYVRRIREKIEVDSNRPELLIAHRAKGYMLRSTPHSSEPLVAP